MNLNILVKQFFVENDYQKISDRIIVLRSDGIKVYSNFENDTEAASIGALVSGLWQAAETLASMDNNKKDYLDFRLGFDSSSDGLYVLPLTVLGSTYYICAIYKDASNPAKMKRHLRLLKDNLEVYLSELSLDNEENRNGYLFSEISDDEMDNLFSFGGM